MMHRNNRPPWMHGLFFWLALFSGCTVLPPPGALHWAVYNHAPGSYRVASTTISMEDRNGISMDSRYARHYADILLKNAELSSTSLKNGHLEITLREQPLDYNVQNLLSISAVLTVTGDDGRTAARIVYIGHSRDGLRSDRLVYEILRKLITKLSHG